MGTSHDLTMLIPIYNWNLKCILFSPTKAPPFLSLRGTNEMSDAAIRVVVEKDCFVNLSSFDRARLKSFRRGKLRMTNLLAMTAFVVESVG